MLFPDTNYINMRLFYLLSVISVNILLICETLKLIHFASEFEKYCVCIEVR